MSFLIEGLQQTMKRGGFDALVLEAGPGLRALTGVGWGRSERLFALVVTHSGREAWVAPAFEEERARELVGRDADVRLWQEDESPFAKVAAILRERGVASGTIGIDGTTRFFVYDGLRAVLPKLTFRTSDALLARR